jgi:hypothetical protein
MINVIGYAGWTHQTGLAIADRIGEPIDVGPQLAEKGWILQS